MLDNVCRVLDMLDGTFASTTGTLSGWLNPHSIMGLVHLFAT